MCIHLAPLAIAGRSAKELFEDRAWRLLPIKRQDTDARDDEVLNEGCIRARYLKSPFECPNRLLGIGGRASLANRLEEWGRIEVLPVHEGASIAMGAAGSTDFLRRPGSRTSASVGQGWERPTDGVAISALRRLHLPKEATHVIGDIPSRQAERKQRSEHPSLDTAEVTHRENLDAATAAVERGRMNLPSAPGLENVRVDHAPLDSARLRPVVVKAFPHDPDRPWVAFGHVGPGLSAVMNFEVLDVDIAPQFRSSSRKVAGSPQHPIRRSRALVDHMHLRHGWMLIPPPQDSP